MTDQDENVGTGKPIPRLQAVRHGAGRTVILTWEDNSITQVDLSAHFARFRVFAPLTDDDLFASVLLDEWGWAIYWPSVRGAAVPSDLLDELSTTQSR